MTRPIINLDALQSFPIGAPGSAVPAKFQGATVAPISPRIGAQKLGYNLTEVPPGKAAFPCHNHHANEEMFFILSGEGELRIGDQRYPVRANDVVACPAGGIETAHQLRNTSATESLRYLSVATAISPDYVQYPDSGKSGAAVYLGRDENGRPKAIRLINREAANLDYWDGE
ncbi:MAG: cupin domain-containing protein [Ahniella sp.]|nr:cupin domain-containing protein [Ahniella sp.]